MAVHRTCKPAECRVQGRNQRRVAVAHDNILDIDVTISPVGSPIFQFAPNERQVFLDEVEDAPADVAYLLYVNDVYKERFDTDSWDKFFAQKTVRPADRLVEHGYVERLDRGLYELVTDPRSDGGEASA